VDPREYSNGLKLNGGYIKRELNEMIQLFKKNKKCNGGNAVQFVKK
jgi:hypothetical protein